MNIKDFKIKKIKKYLRAGEKIKFSSVPKKPNEEEKLIIKIVEVMNTSDIEERYSLIYDYLCEYMDEDMMLHQYCDFKDGKCIANRLGLSVHEADGCCYSWKWGQCQFLNKNEGICTNKNPGCKLFMCSYVEKKYKFKYNLEDIFPVKYFLNRKQINIISRSFFKTKEYIITKMMQAIK